jgi:hypothetical protein
MAYAEVLSSGLARQACQAQLAGSGAIHGVIGDHDGRPQGRAAECYPMTRSSRTSSGSSGHDLPAATIAHCGGWPDERRRGWAERDLLKRAPPFIPHDAVETAVAARLAERTNKNSAPQAWRAVRQEVRELAMAGDDDIWIVLTQAGMSHAPDARAVSGATAAGAAAAELGTLVWVVPVRDAICRARARFAAAIEGGAQTGSGSVVPHLRDHGGQA